MLLNDRMMDWFPVQLGVRQVESPSPIPFALFVNDLAGNLNRLAEGIHINNLNLSIFMYADDVDILSDSLGDAHEQLDIMSKLCNTWDMIINITKFQVVHHRNHQKLKCEKQLLLDEKVMDYVSDYKYPGCWINVFGNDEKTVEALTSVAGSSYGGLRVFSKNLEIWSQNFLYLK